MSLFSHSSALYEENRDIFVSLYSLFIKEREMIAFCIAYSKRDAVALVRRIDKIIGLFCKRAL